MPGSLYQRAFRFCASIANIGIDQDLNYFEKKKIQVINLAISAGFFPNIIFAVINYHEGRMAAVYVNMLLFSGGVLTLWMHHKKKYPVARLLMTVAASCVFSAGAILYRNSGEFYLLANLMIIVIYFSETWFLILMVTFNCLLFIAIRIYLQYTPAIDTVPFDRTMFNIIWALLLMVIALLFFKREQNFYRKRIEEKNIELENINHSKEKIFSIIAHDLRSPIAQLKNSLQLVNRDYISAEKFTDIAAKLETQVDQLHSTMDNLLRWSQSQLQGISVNPENVLLAPVIENKIRLYQQRLEEKQLSLVVEGTDKVLYVDRDHLLLILRNLISNAIKYSHPGGTVTVRYKSDRDQVIIAVSDNGVGMSSEMIDSILQPDKIESKPGTSDEKGTGLGLKLCREFIEKNNGTLRVESIENRGTTFYVTLPAAI